MSFSTPSGLIHQQVHAGLARHRSRKLYISRNFQRVSTCSSGNGGGPDAKAFWRQVQHHAAVLADGVEHHRVVGLGDHLAHDVDALGFEALQVGQAFVVRVRLDIAPLCRGRAAHAANISASGATLFACKG
jgi:hypothetical protein